MMFKRADTSIGIDIGSQAIKMVKLRLLKGSAELLAFAFEEGCSDLAGALKRIMQPEKIRKVNISVSGPEVLTRYVNFPRMSQEELTSSLKFEVQKHIPFSISEVNLDSVILKANLPDNKMLVLVAAVKKEFINQRLKFLQDAGLSVNIIEVDSLALINSFNFSYCDEPELKNKAVALLNIGGAFSNLNILEECVPRLSRDIQIAGNDFTRKLQEVSAVNFEMAEVLKLNPKNENLDKIIRAVDPVAANLANEIRTSFDYYESQSSSSVSKIFLSGAGSKFKGLKDVLANLVGIEVQYWDPLKKISTADITDIEKLKDKAAELAVAIGVALRTRK